jgi:hypothetical protein
MTCEQLRRRLDIPDPFLRRHEQHKKDAKHQAELNEKAAKEAAKEAKREQKELKKL